MMEASSVGDKRSQKLAPSVFISYSRSDLNAVRPLAAQLRRLGVRTWMDLEDLRPGERWKNAIDSALASSSAMLYCLSPLTMESAWTSVELKAALRQKKPIIPVMVEPLEIEALPPELQQLHIYDMASYPATQSIEISAVAIASALGLEVPQKSSDENLSDAPQVLVLHLGRRPDIDTLVSQVGWISTVETQTICWPVQALTASQLSDIEQQLKQVSHAIICVSDQSQIALANLLMGSVSAKLGPRRLTIADTTGDQILKSAADAVSAYYLPFKQTCADQDVTKSDHSVPSKETQ